MGQKVNPIAVRMNFNRFSDSSWFSDYYYSAIFHQDLNFRQYLSSIKQPNANKLGLRTGKCTFHHFPKRCEIHLFCLSDLRKNNCYSEAGVSPYWLESSMLYKKKALVNLQRGIVNALAEMCFVPRFAKQINRANKKSVCPFRPWAHYFAIFCRPLLRPVAQVAQDPSAQGGQQRHKQTTPPLLPTPAIPKVCPGPFGPGLRSKSTEVRPEGAEGVCRPPWAEGAGVRTKGRREQRTSGTSLSTPLGGTSGTSGGQQRPQRGKEACLEVLTPLGTNRGEDAKQRTMVDLRSNGGDATASQTRKSSFLHSMRCFLNLYTMHFYFLQKVNSFYNFGPSFATVGRENSLRYSVSAPNASTPGRRTFDQVCLHSGHSQRGKNRGCEAKGDTGEGFFRSLVVFASVDALILAQVCPWAHGSQQRPQRGKVRPKGAGVRTKVDPHGRSEQRHRSVDLTWQEGVASFALGPGVFASKGRLLTPLGKPISAPSAQVCVANQQRCDRRESVDPPGRRERRERGQQAQLPMGVDRGLLTPMGRPMLTPLGRRGTNRGLLTPLGGGPASLSVQTSVMNSFYITKSLDFYLSNINFILSLGTRSFISLRTAKVQSIFQSASLIAQEIACKLEQKRSFRLICRILFQQLANCRYVKGIRVACSGRLNGAEIAKTECRKFGETSLHVFSEKIDYAQAKASTPYGILGIKVWISYI